MDYENNGAISELEARKRDRKVYLSEKPEAQREAVLWAKEEAERIRRSDEATKEFKEKFTALFLANIEKAKA